MLIFEEVRSRGVELELLVKGHKQNQTLYCMIKLIQPFEANY